MSRLPFKGDLFAATVVLLAALGELALRESFYQLAIEIPRMLAVLGVWMAMMSAAFFAASGLRTGSVSSAGRFSVAVALAVWLYVVTGELITAVLGVGAGLLFIVSTTALAAWAFVRADAAPWVGTRRAVCTASVVFVACQPIISYVRAPSLSWPDRIVSEAEEGNAVPVRPDVTVFLLLDELNAKAADPLIAALSKSGRDVHAKAILPVDDATSRVVPSMFSGEHFADAKPCGIHTVCSGRHVLDFSQVVASRPNVDVVGFYEPYCAIRGLRYCLRLAPDSPIFDARRWWCAALRRSTWLVSVAPAEAGLKCAQLSGAIWSSLASRVEHAIWRAPVWRDGGFLYAHVPLPHPPGESGGGSLAAHYQANLERAAALVTRIGQELARQPERRFRVVVFSDHPLRPHLWCAGGQYSSNGCPLSSHLADDKVPLIAIGDIPTAFHTIKSNIEIFELAR